MSAFDEAHAILVAHAAGATPPPADELVALADEISGPGEQRVRRRLLDLAVAQRPDDIAIRQKLAHTTYSDPDLPAAERLDRAIAILADGGTLDTTTDQETLSLAGAIHKRWWELDGRLEHLERALDYYRFAHDQHVADDDYNGYPGINAAFILDLLAAPAERNKPRSKQVTEAVADRRENAQQIRRGIADVLRPRLQRKGSYTEDDYWQLVTLAEALFGQGGHGDAQPWLQEAATTKPKDWMIESTARQLARIAQLQGIDLTATPAGAAARAIGALMGDDAAAAGLTSVQIGKVGLALSGGGFRASLFHIGVLARLAELDVLRHVEVLSCVSGGSILGAAYYLMLRERLEQQPDGTLTRADYIELVQALEASFRKGVDENLRGHLFTSPLADAKMLALPGFNRTTHAGELYEKLFYKPIFGPGARRRLFGFLRPVPRPRMRELHVRPAGDVADFRPQDHNWRRRNKVPVLIVNATSLNTGHAWQFTASWMGEPPSWSAEDVDRNVRLRRMYYDQAGPHRNLALGTAVAASAAVPGIFPPITLRRLYPDTTVRLADGGVHDNQGIAGLVGQDCSVMIISDASGQMAELANPPELAYRVLKRSSSAQGARVRTTQWHDLRARARGGALRGLMFLHLRSGLGGIARDWIGCNDPQESEIKEPSADTQTEYGMRRDVQATLAQLRTDLDAFSAVETNALMTSGYRMATYEFPRCLPDIPTDGAPPIDWDFLRGFEEEIATTEKAGETVRALEIGSGRFFRRAKHMASR